MLISVAVPVPALPLLTYRLPPDSPGAVRGARVLVPLGRRTVTGIVVGPARRSGARRRFVTPPRFSTPRRFCPTRSWTSPCGWPTTTSRRLATRWRRQPAVRLARERAALRTDRRKGAACSDGPAAGDPLLRALDRGPSDAAGPDRQGGVNRRRSRPPSAASNARGSRARTCAAGSHRRIPNRVAGVADAGRRVGCTGAHRRAIAPRSRRTPAGEHDDACGVSRAADAGALRERGSDLGSRSAGSRAAASFISRSGGSTAIPSRRARRSMFPWKRCASSPRISSRAAALTALAGEQRFTRGAAARRDRQRQDRAATCGWRATPSRAGRRVLVLVPEIALTPQMAAQFRAAFGDRVAIQHSGTVRRRASRSVAPDPRWRRRRRRRHPLGRVRAASNASGSSSSTRSTTAPTSRTRAPRYHGRDVAVVRAQAARRARRARLGDAVARVVSRTPRAADARRSCCRAACSIVRWPA